MIEEKVEVVVKAKNLTEEEKLYHLNRAASIFGQAYKECPNVVKHIEGKPIKKIIYVPDKVLNIIVDSN